MDSKKKAMLWKFLVSTIIGVIVFGAILIKACSIIPFGIDYKNEELKKITDGIKFLDENQEQAMPQVIRLGKSSMLYLIQKGESEVKYYSKDTTYVVKRPKGCDLDFTCLCYCEKSQENEENGLTYHVCRLGSLNCEDYKNKFNLVNDVSNFFGFKEDNDQLKFENGFMISKDLDGMPDMNYRIDLKLQKTSSGIAICMKKGLCVDEYKGAVLYTDASTTSSSTTSTSSSTKTST